MPPTSSTMLLRLFLSAFCGLLLMTAQAGAEPPKTPEPPNRLRVGGGTNLPIPRFVSLGSSVINLRRGPGKDYPVDWVLKKRGMPVEIVAEYEQWRRIRIMDGSEGWVHQNLLSGKRTALVATPEIALLDKANVNSAEIARLRQGVLLTLDDCLNPQFCKVEVGGHKGFIARTGLYGLYASERFED
ncbi:MAG: SH3 domain-containing protein [Alphaproteobacteria bacterium]